MEKQICLMNGRGSTDEHYKPLSIMIFEDFWLLSCRMSMVPDIVLPSSSYSDDSSGPSSLRVEPEARIELAVLTAAACLCDDRCGTGTRTEPSVPVDASAFADHNASTTLFMRCSKRHGDVAKLKSWPWEPFESLGDAVSSHDTLTSINLSRVSSLWLFLCILPRLHYS